MYFVRPHVCLSVSPSTHRKHVTCVDVAFYFKLFFGGMDLGLSLDLCFVGGGSVFLKLSFVGRWGWFYFEFLGIIFYQGDFFIKFFSLFCGGSLLRFV